MLAIDRRQFVKGVAAAAILNGTLQSAQSALREVPFGFSLYGAPGIAPAVALPQIRKLGYNCVELSCLKGSPTEPQALNAGARVALRELLIDQSLPLAGLMENLSEPVEDAAHRTNLERLAAACELGHDLSPRSQPVVETVLGHKPNQWEQVRERMAERLHAWAALAEKHKTIIVVKPHVAHALHLPQQALWLMQQVNSPWLKLAYDYSHYALRDLPLAETISALAQHIKFVHVKDARGTAEKFEFLLPGETDLNYVELFRQLAAGGYHGAIVVEVSSQLSRRPDYDWHFAARRSYENLAPALDRAARGR